MPKLAITGKGGVGKTTLAALLAHLYAQEGRTVLAIDADPDANLASALGFPEELVEAIVPIAELQDLIAERTGAQPGTFGGMFKLNPRVDDIPDRYAVSHQGVKLLTLGTIDHGGSGCICPESTLLRALMQHLVIRRSEAIIMDMEAGLEHLGRATAGSMDAFIVVVEPGQRSIQTAKSVRRLASDIGVDRVYVVGNKTRSESDRAFILDNLPGDEILGFLSYSPLAIEADLQGKAIFEMDPGIVQQARLIKDKLAFMAEEE
ncbi:MAG: carbon monoxide dehydrogenase accessory protein CooC [Chloroflexota bacterium]|nr:carbon monoxide dehydrogenase accessory protein CooC [Anaerolineae bacterium]